MKCTFPTGHTIETFSISSLEVRMPILSLWGIFKLPAIKGTSHRLRLLRVTRGSWLLRIPHATEPVSGYLVFYLRSSDTNRKIDLRAARHYLFILLLLADRKCFACSARLIQAYLSFACINYNFFRILPVNFL